MKAENGVYTLFWRFLTWPDVNGENNLQALHFPGPDFHKILDKTGVNVVWDCSQELKMEESTWYKNKYDVIESEE